MRTIYYRVYSPQTLIGLLLQVYEKLKDEESTCQGILGNLENGIRHFIICSS